MTKRYAFIIIMAVCSVAASAQNTCRKDGARTSLHVQQMEGHNGFRLIQYCNGKKILLAFSDENPADTNLIHGLAGSGGLTVQHGNEATETETESTDEGEDTFMEIEPMISSQWTGFYPYNTQLPGRSDAGSLGTALAQLMRYHRYPDTCDGCPGYQGPFSDRTVDALPPVSFNWDMMPDKLGDASTEAEISAVAELMRYAAQAVSTDFYYYTAASFTSVPLAMVKYMGYDPGMRFMNRINEGVDDWYAALHESLESGNPVLYFAAGMQGGMAFLIDGYRHGGFFHINWGRGGVADGWYRLQHLDAFGPEPEKCLYQSHSMVTGIRPHTGGEQQTEDTRMESLYLDVWNRTYTPGEYYYYKDIPISYQVENALQDIYDIDYGLGMYLDDSLALVIDSVYCEQMAPRTYSRDALVNISYKTPDGDYTVKTISKLHGDSEWRPCRHNGGYDVGISISKRVLNTTLRGYPGKDIITHGIYATGKNVGIKQYECLFDITNEGPDYSGEIYVWYVQGGGFPNFVPSFLEIRRGERRMVPFTLPVHGENYYVFVTPIFDEFYDPIIQGPLQNEAACKELAADEKADPNIYDLQGRRLQAAPAKGLYIRGGKKYLVR